jgi:DNA modification methylase
MIMNDNTEYQDFLQQKKITVKPSGFDVDLDDINPMLFEFQRDIVRWALGKGKAALFEDCGLGKTPQQLEWARLVNQHTNKPVIIFAPLAVANQTEKEGEKFNVPVNICVNQADVINGVNITNYEKLHHFEPYDEWGEPVYGGIVLDESSILKGFDGKTRKVLNEFAISIPYRLCCTATPAPNDLTELTRHAEFLGLVSEKEIKALFFTQDGNTTTKWRLKGHARDKFWQWMGKWSVALRAPSDLGYDDNGFVLPALEMHSHVVNGVVPQGFLVPVTAKTMNERRAARRTSLDDRVAIAAKMVNESDESWLLWCDLNAESTKLTAAIPDAVEVAGRHSDNHKKWAMLGFSEGKHRVLVTKPSIGGFGMNWQHCHNMAFVGLSDSYEKQYQAIRRCWRFGQKETVNVHVVTADTEGAVVANIERKEKQAIEMFDNVVKHMSVNTDLNQKTERFEMDYELDIAHGDDWTLYLGDSVETIEHLEDNSIGLSVFSPPFPGMYVYTNSIHDMGNVKDNQEMIQQFAFLSRKILAKTMPGRTCAIHLTQSTAQLGRDGYVGIKDFRGQVIRMMEDEGWIYYGEACIDKNPQVKAIRTKDHGLMFKTLSKDSTKMHMALADYLIQFVKPGENPHPLRAGISERYDNMDGWITNEEWILWARPVWYSADLIPEGAIDKGIRETETLNVRQARETDDERHLAPLQLGVIRRAILLWSGPGELVYSPFAGIGSEGYEAIKLGRRFVGGELKRSYWKSAIDNLRSATRELGTMTLFDFAQMKVDAEANQNE